MPCGAVSVANVRMVWHRDVNACLNIMYVFINEWIKGFRPGIFTRAFQQQQHV